MPTGNIKPDIASLQRQLRTGLRLATLGANQASRAAGRLLWIATKRGLGVILALVLLFEQWGWQPLAAALATLARLAPVAALERTIGRLPPYAALVVFAVPVVLLIPLKLFALFLIADGHAISAALLFIAAKIIGTALVARLYTLTSPQLLQIVWLRRAHDLLMPRLHAVHDDIRRSWAWRYGRMLKTATKRAARPIVAGIKVRLMALFAGHSGTA